MNDIIAYICLTGLVLPIVILYINKGYLSTNRYLAGFLFFASLYLLENYHYFYGQNKFWVTIFTNTHAFFYLIGPFAYFYVRGILTDQSKLHGADYLHFALFGISFIGYLPYIFFSDWAYKGLISENIMSNDWDMAPFRINKIIPHKLDQLLNILHTYFYCISLWYLVWRHKKQKNSFLKKTNQFNLITRWVVLFVTVFTIITINFTLAMAYMWKYDNKDVFLQLANGSLFFASCVYIFINTSVLFFPHILYGLPMELIPIPSRPDAKTSDENLNTIGTVRTLESDISNKGLEFNASLKLFTNEYVNIIERALKTCIESEKYLMQDFKLATISLQSGIPPHHLTYYFNCTLGASFSDWRNNLRIGHSVNLIEADKNKLYTLQAIGELSGFSSYSTFIRAFKNATGCTPGEYVSK
jgi:AraC-like DNA-binding protein